MTCEHDPHGSAPSNPPAQRSKSRPNVVTAGHNFGRQSISWRLVIAPLEISLMAQKDVAGRFAIQRLRVQQGLQD